jgi:enhancing lycopene biosynthesis protein 2
MKVGILLSGCGVYDGSEIQETVAAMIALEEKGIEYVGISIDKNQHHVVNHLDGSEMNETRNMMIESARIMRGNVVNIQTISPADIDGLVIPGGFGNAKNLSNWAFQGSDSELIPEVKLLLVNLINIGKPIVALCVSPILLSLALKDSRFSPTLSLGTSKEKSPYDISAFHKEIEKNGGKSTEKGINEISIDLENKIICAPCYMQDASLLEIKNNATMAIEKLIEFID